MGITRIHGYIIRFSLAYLFTVLTYFLSYLLTYYLLTYLLEVNPDLDPPPAESARPMHGDNPALVAGLSPTVKLAAECVLAVLDQEAMR
jgi:hypothetical protein